MYNAFFGFTQNPFNMSPDPAFLYRSTQHEEALANLIYGVQSRKGFIVLTGEVGTGKTTMLECLRDFLHAQQIAFASLFNSRLTVEQFFELLSYDLDLRCNRHSKTEVLLSLNNFLMERTAGGRTTVLIVDEAHNLDWEVLEEIRLLGNLENRRGKLMQIILAGQQELDRKLEQPEYRQLKQRISLRCLLRGFEPSETTAYIESRMSKAGLKDQAIFSPDLIEEIHYRSQGIPRLINGICDNLLLTSFAMESHVATLEMLDEVTKDMRLDYPGNRPFRPDPSYPQRVLRTSEIPFRD
jgi:general secretion pathway protein A